jgi:hypothetical protein
VVAEDCNHELLRIRLFAKFRARRISLSPYRKYSSLFDRCQYAVQPRGGSVYVRK